MGLRAERVEDVHAGGAHGGEEPAEENSAIIIPRMVRNMVVSRWPA
jgi:hypothetical protein